MPRCTASHETLAEQLSLLGSNFTISHAFVQRTPAATTLFHSQLQLSQLSLGAADRLGQPLSPKYFETSGRDMEIIKVGVLMFSSNVSLQDLVQVVPSPWAEVEYKPSQIPSFFCLGIRFISRFDTFRSLLHFYSFTHF